MMYLPYAHCGINAAAAVRVVLVAAAVVVVVVKVVCYATVITVGVTVTEVK